MDGVIINQYHTDNGVFKASVLLEHSENKKQTIKFSGSGAPHQNGIAESVSDVVVAMERTIMIHAEIHQPEGIESIGVGGYDNHLSS